MSLNLPLSISVRSPSLTNLDLEDWVKKEASPVQNEGCSKKKIAKFAIAFFINLGLAAIMGCFGGVYVGITVGVVSALIWGGTLYWQHRKVTQLTEAEIINDLDSEKIDTSLTDLIEQQQAELKKKELEEAELKKKELEEAARKTKEEMQKKKEVEIASLKEKIATAQENINTATKNLINAEKNIILFNKQIEDHTKVHQDTLINYKPPLKLQFSQMFKIGNHQEKLNKNYDNYRNQALKSTQSEYDAAQKVLPEVLKYKGELEKIIRNNQAEIDKVGKELETLTKPEE